MNALSKFLATILTAGVLILVPGTQRAVSADFPMPDDVTVTEPGGEIPDEWAAFSGSWKGKWDSKAPIMYVVESIYPDGKAIIVYSWAKYQPWNWKAGFERNVGTIQDNVLTFKNRHGTYTQQILESGKMRSDFVGEGRSKGVNGTSILKKQD